MVGDICKSGIADCIDLSVYVFVIPTTAKVSDSQAETPGRRPTNGYDGMKIAVYCVG